MAIQQGKPPEQHLGYLDSVRGIAALSVMVYHFINWKYENRIEAKAASIIFNGSDAVSFFFVLSGFALSYKYITLNHSLDIRKFYVNRIFRLWPAFLLTIILNALNWNRLNLDAHTLYNVFILNKTGFWQEALLLRAHPQYYSPGWTLVIELAISFFVPFMIVLAKKDKRIMYWLLFAFIFIGGNMGDFYMFHFHFALGILLSCLFSSIQNDSFRNTLFYRYRYIILSACFALYSIRHICRIYPAGNAYTVIAKYIGIDFFHYTGLASFVFIAAMIASRRFQAIFENKILRFFGVISYGIYLVHWLFVTDVFIYWDKLASCFPGTKTAFIVIFFCYSAATILLATLLHYTVELPFMRIGKRLTQRMKPSLRI